MNLKRYFRLEKTFASRSHWRVIVIEKADVYLMYGTANSNGRESLKLYREKFPNKKMPDLKLFSYLLRELRESGSFHVKRPDADLFETCTSSRNRRTHSE